MNPVAVPTQQPEQMAPVAPPDVNNPAPVGDAVAPTQAINTDLHSMYEDAASNGDPASMYSLTSRAKGTPYEGAVKRSAEVMQKNLKEFESDIKPVIEAGGPGTPAGNLAASKTFQTIADKPQKMRAFVEMLLGNPKWRTFVTGGTETTSIGYDRNGKQLERTVNELGQTINVLDSETGAPIDRKQLADRGGFLTSLDNAIGFQSQKDIAKFNTEAFNKSNAATQEYTAKAPELKGMYEEMRQRLQNLYGADLTPEQRAAIGSFTSRSMGYSQTVSEGLNALRQKTDNKNASLSRSEQTALKAVMDKLGFNIGADGSVVNKKGENVTKSELDQAQNTLNNGSQFERNFTQNKDDFIRSEVFKGLSEGDMKNLNRILDLQGMAEKTSIELAGKHGTLPFLVNPKSYQLGDEFSRGEALALVGEFNQDATQLYSAWRDKQLDTYKRSGKVPNAGELEAAFSKTAEFQKLRNDYAAKNKEILKRPGSSRPAQEAGTANQWSIDVGLGETAKEAPKGVRGRSLKEPTVKSDIPSGYTRIGTTPNGKAVFRTPDGKQVTEP